MTQTQGGRKDPFWLNSHLFSINDIPPHTVCKHAIESMEGVAGTGGGSGCSTGGRIFVMLAKASSRTRQTLGKPLFLKRSLDGHRYRNPTQRGISGPYQLIFEKFHFFETDFQHLPPRPENDFLNFVPLMSWQCETGSILTNLFHQSTHRHRTKLACDYSLRFGRWLDGQMALFP